MSNLSLNTAGLNFIKEHEGLCLNFYADSYGYPTVGYGHCITKKYTYTPNSPLTQAQADALSANLSLDYCSPITQAKANALLSSDVKWAVDAVNGLILPTGCQFSQSQFNALVSLVFNCGSGVLLTSDVVAMYNCPNIYSSYARSLTAGQSDTCSRLVSKAFSYDRTLQKRRNEEATLFCSCENYTHKYPVYTLQ